MLIYIYTSADVFYVELYEKIYAKFTYTILCGFKNPTWILCECDFYIENMFTQIYIDFLFKIYKTIYIYVFTILYILYRFFI